MIHSSNESFILHEALVQTDLAHVITSVIARPHELLPRASTGLRATVQELRFYSINILMTYDFSVIGDL